MFVTYSATCRLQTRGLLGKLMFASTSATDGAFGVVGTALLAQSIVQFFLLYLPEYAAMGMVAELFVAYIFGVYIVLNIFRALLTPKSTGVDKTPGKTLKQKASKVAPKGGSPPRRGAPGKRAMV